MFAALADPVGGRSWGRLGEQALLVSELAPPFDISLQAVSSHIQVLVRAGRVGQERTGRISRCSLMAGPVFAAAVWTNRYSKYWQAQFDLLAATLEDIDQRRAREGSQRRREARAGARDANERSWLMTLGVLRKFIVPEIGCRDGKPRGCSGRMDQGAQGALAKEKEFTRLRDQLSQQRRALPWVRSTRRMSSTGRTARRRSPTLRGKSQLIVYHFMFAPTWEAGCKSCSFWADNFNGIPVHLEHRDVTCRVSRAPLEKLEAFKKRMGWSFKWVCRRAPTSTTTIGVSFTPEDGRGEGVQLQGEIRSAELPGDQRLLQG